METVVKAASQTNRRSLTLAAQHTYSEEIKKSRFIASAFPVESAEEAMAKMEAVRAADATHNCWAYKVQDQYRFNDDGEPGGTAGRPILAAIEAQGVDNVLVVVTRYFGGTKLGTGGLVRAYGGTAAKCLNGAPKTEIKQMISVVVDAPFEAIGSVYPVLEQFGAAKLNEAYTQTGVSLTLELDDGSRVAFEKALRNATRGRVKLET
ncbi:MAG: YigZ family protein [Deltaproteobacteria bacterium]|nr:YigZ family protein [Deltaproteobacteria bacterium]